MELLKVDGIKPKKITVNGNKCKRVICNDILVWVSELDVLGKKTGQWTYIDKTYFNVNAKIETQTASDLTVTCYAAAGTAAGCINAYCGTFNISDYDKLTVTCESLTESYEHINGDVGARIGFVSSIPESRSDENSGFVNDNAAFVKLDKYIQITGPGTFTLSWTGDELSGEKYIVVQLTSEYLGYTDGPTASMKITSMKLE